MDEPAGIEVGTTQKRVTAERIGVRKAQGIWSGQEVQALSPVLVGDMDPVLALFSFER